MLTYEFQVSRQSRDFCDEIAREMVRMCGFDLAEAVGRINQQWRGVDFLEADDLRYHEDPEYWACKLLHGAYKPADLEAGILKPLPYP